MLTKSDNKEKGMALLLVISLVAILSIITLQFGVDMRQQYIVSAGLRNNFKLSEMGRSGITITQGILKQDRKDNNFDCLFDSWALLAEADLTTLFEHGKLEVSVIDESGKFPVNAMVRIKKESAKKPENEDELKDLKQKERNVRNVLWRLMRAEPFLLEDGDARGIIDALIDWIDSGDGDGEEEYGAEDSYYKGLDPPYACKNGPIESIEELLLVKGITAEILYGTEDKPGLAPLITPWGDDGKINLNTAEQSLLQAMAFDISKKAAENMALFREEEGNKEQLKSPQWYKTVPSFPGDVEITEDLMTAESMYFTIQASAKINTLQKTITATVKRTEKELMIIRWQAE